MRMRIGKGFLLAGRFLYICALFFVLFSGFVVCDVLAQTGRLESELLHRDNDTVFAIYFDNNLKAWSVCGQLKPINVIKKKLPAVQNEGGVRYVHIKMGEALGYKSVGWFPSERGTVEMLIRYQQGKGHDNVSSRDHLFTLFKNNNERIYLRFYGLGTVHYLFRNGRPICQKYVHIKSSLIDSNRWAHIALEWDCGGGDRNVRVWLYLDGRCISAYKGNAFSPIKADERTIFWVGSYVNGQFPADEFDIRGIRVSKVLRFSGEQVIGVRDAIGFQKYGVVLRKIQQAKGFGDVLSGSARAELSKFEDELRISEKEYFGSKERKLKGALLSKLEYIDKAVTKIVEQAAGRVWCKENMGKALIKGKRFGVFCETSMRKISQKRARYKPTGQVGVNLCACRNERESFQIIVAGVDSDKLLSLRISGSDLIGSDGEKISSDNVKIYRVGSIAGIYADPLFPVGKAEDIKYPDIGVFWVTVYVPEGVRSGIYKGMIRLVELNGGEEIDVPYEIKVWNATLPRQSALKTAFGLSPEFIAVLSNDNGVRKIEKLKDAYVRYMLAHRTSPKAYLRFGLELSGSVKRGLSAEKKEIALRSGRNFFHPRQILKSDGSIVLDFEEFDRMVEKYIPLGLNSFVAGNRFWDAQNSARGSKPVEYSRLRHRLWVYDESLGRYRTLYLNVLSLEYVRVMKSVFSQWQVHLEKKGWLGMGYGYIMDEPTNEMFGLVSKLYGIAKEAAPKIPLLLTHSPASGLSNVDIWCIQFPWYSAKTIEAELKDGKHLWFYVCIGPERPYGNFFLYQEPIEHRILFWQTYKYRGEGFLYWEVNYWNDGNPLAYLKEGITFDKNMDGKLLYPGADGPIGSIRYENIRDGIEDYDYLVLLKKVCNDGRLKGKLKLRAERILSIPPELVRSARQFSHNPNVLLGFRKEIGEILDKVGE